MSPLSALKWIMVDRLGMQKSVSSFGVKLRAVSAEIVVNRHACLRFVNVDACILDGRGLVEYRNAPAEANSFVVSAPGLLHCHVSVSFSQIPMKVDVRQFLPDSVEVQYVCGEETTSFLLTIFIHDQVIFSAWTNRPSFLRVDCVPRLCVSYTQWLRLIDWSACGGNMIKRVLTVMGNNSSTATIVSCSGSNFYLNLLLAAKRHDEDVHIQELVCKVLCYCCYWCPKEIVLDCDIVAYLCRVMQLHASCRHIQDRGCWCFQHIAQSSQENRAMLFQEKDVLKVCWQARIVTSWCALHTIAVLDTKGDASC